jgi:hypothetical protein
VDELGLAVPLTVGANSPYPGSTCSPVAVPKFEASSIKRRNDKTVQIRVVPETEFTQ